MKNPQKKRCLTAEERRECEALNAIYKAKKKALGITQERIAIEGLKAGSQSAASHYLTGRNALNIEAAAIFARYLQVSVSEFSPRLAREIGEMAQAIIEGEPAPSLTNDAPAERLELPAFLRGVDEHSNVQGGPVAIRDGVVPVVGMAKLGAQGYFDAIDYPVGHGDGYVLISSSDENAYALRVVGDSMEPRIRNGEFVMIEPNKPYTSGDDVLVQITDGALVQSMIKVFMHEREGFVRLLSVNDSHAPMTVERTRILKIHPVGAILKPSRYIAAG